MKKWILKAIVQKSISFLPFKHRINYLFQKHVTKGVFLSDEYFFDRLTHAKFHISAFKNHYGHSNIDSSLEIGTGWYPVVPISIYLSGGKDIFTLDLSELLNKANLITTLERLVEHADKGQLAGYLDVQKNRLDVLRDLLEKKDTLDLKAMLAKLNIHYQVGETKLGEVPSGSIQFITSNNTFEHVYPEAMPIILKEFMRVGDKINLMSHFIDMSDHFAHFDKTISIYNFLKYSEAQWKYIDNSVQPMNRWRITDFKKLYDSLGLKIIYEESRPGDVAELKANNPHPMFLKAPLEEVAKSHCYFVSVRKM